ncbi:conserved hypothetical protein [Ixodes scapularis]|uniref:Methyltransferase-like protein 22 n=1 Tax=Ixodes scapularis TaxID=6945 RepID=B7Q9F2_IXOSC|nr:conserved hypothetical protein [Ixodes scapularis]|eukprot:XP_002405833.1 conserved hypothetical protein [Ixodes scapularis]
MQDGEVVVSEVHVDSDNMLMPDDPLLRLVPATLRKRLQVGRSRLLVDWFAFGKDVEEECGGDLALDDDGDLAVSRPRRRVTLQIDHFLSSTLEGVGLQVWKASLLLSDFLLDRGFEVLGSRGCLELGCGAGLCGLVAAAFADWVYCTDARDEVLALCQRNLNSNEAFYDALGADDQQPRAHVRRLDWAHGPPLKGEPPVGPWDWTSQDLDNLSRVRVFLAADVVYDDSLTDHLFDLLCRLATHEDQLVYLAQERRVNFSLSLLEVASPAHTHLCHWLERLRGTGWRVDRLDTSFPQRLHPYSRDDYLELWRLQPPSTSVMPA